MKKNSYFWSHPMYAQWIKDNTNIANVLAKFEDELPIINALKKDVKILEIGYWKWDFAEFCFKKWFTNYTWIEVDNGFEDYNKKRFSKYNFSMTSIWDFFASHSWFDIIFMAHVFEHLNDDEANETVSLIFENLNIWWYWINYMPNADSPKAAALRYIDITHKMIYNSHSFEQRLLFNNAFFSEIKHYNTLPSINPIFKFIFKIIHPFFLITTKIYFTGMWLIFPKIYSSEILSIMKK